MAYRGYSLSTGSPSFYGLKQDGLAVLSYCLETQKIFNRSKVLIQGASLGAAVALHTLSSSPLVKQLKGFIIENTFSSIGDMADIYYPKLRFFRRLLLRNDWNNLMYVSRLPKHLKALFITGKLDEITPTYMTKMIHQNCILKDKKLVEYATGTHNNTWFVHKYEYFQEVSRFLDRLFK